VNPIAIGRGGCCRRRSARAPKVAAEVVLGKARARARCQAKLAAGERRHGATPLVVAVGLG